MDSFIDGVWGLGRQLGQQSMHKYMQNVYNTKCRMPNAKCLSSYSISRDDVINYVSALLRYTELVRYSSKST